MSNHQGGLSWWLVVFLSLHIASCSSDKEPIKQTAARDLDVPLKITTVEELISHLPSDVLPARGTIRIRFHDEQAGRHQIGVRMIKSNFSFQPPIDGYQSWFDSRTIVFYPDSELDSNTEYIGMLDVESLIAEIEVGEEVSFAFRVAGQEVAEVSPVISSVPGGEPNQVVIYHDSTVHRADRYGRGHRQDNHDRGRQADRA